MKMRITFALAVFALAQLIAESASAQSETWYRCPTSGTYYPVVSTCPVPWVAVDPWASRRRSSQPEYYNPYDPHEGSGNYSKYGG